MNTSDLSGCQPKIEYPCQWHFRLIGEERAAMIEAIKSVVDTRAYLISEGNASSGGRYMSINVEMSVQDEAERMRLYQVFGGHSAIRVVL